MTKLDSFLNNHDLEGTALNSFGEAIYLGKASELKRTKFAYSIRWNVPEKKEHISPFDKMILHDGKDIFGVLNMPPFRLDKYTKVQVTVK
jgi:hypothetical protein